MFPLLFWTCDLYELRWLSWRSSRVWPMHWKVVKHGIRWRQMSMCNIKYKISFVLLFFFRLIRKACYTIVSFIRIVFDISFLCRRVIFWSDLPSSNYHLKMHNTSDAQLYHYDPSLTAAVIFIVLFTLTTVLHVYQATRTGTRFMIPLIIGAFSKSATSNTPPWNWPNSPSTSGASRLHRPRSGQSAKS